MKEVHLQEAQISPIQLDVKQHSNKTLSELQMLLQTASTLKGAVTGVTKEGNVIFTTVQGKFSAQIPTLAQTLNKGDKLALKIEFDNEQLMGRVISINAVPVKEAKAVAINLVELAAESSAISTRASGKNVNINPLKLPQAPLEVIVDYLNLSLINKNSALGEVLAPARNGSMIELKLTAINQTSSKSPYSVIGEVLSSDENKQISGFPTA